MSSTVAAVMVVHRVVGATICCGLVVKGGCWRFVIFSDRFCGCHISFSWWLCGS